MIAPAIHPVSGAEPMVFLAGGPGGPATEYAPFYQDLADPYRQHRDVVLFDLRGTGRSNPLHCPGIEPPVREPRLAYRNPYGAVAVRRCREKLERSASLAAYNTSAAVHDLDAIRAALGYARLNLRGLSYGTTYALAYIHTYPNHVRAAVLESTAPPADLPLTAFATSAQRALDLIIARCAAEPDCKARYPDVRADLTAAKARIAHDHGFTGTAGPNKRSVTFVATPAQFMEDLRGPLSVSPLAAQVPQLLHRAAGGDFQMFVDLTISGKLKANSFSRGLYFSMMCSDAYPHLDYPKARAVQARTDFGDYKLVTQKAVCDQWPGAPPPPSYYEEPASEVPTLFLSGELDPVTPPAWATRVAARFRHAKQMIVPGMAHIPASEAEVACLTAVETAFLDQPDVTKLDTGCVSKIAVALVP